MHERLVIYVLLCAAYFRGQQGQSIDSLVKNAIDSAFSESAQDIGSFFERRVSGEHAFLSPLVESQSRNIRGSSAVNALNRFSQSEAPEMNKMLEDNAKRAAKATMNLLMASFESSMLDDLQGDENNRTCTLTFEPKYAHPFQRHFRSHCKIPDPPVCDYQYPYRMVDGSCNNLYNPLLGKSFTPQSRILRNAYDNCIDKPRILSKHGRWPLPSARVVSNAVLSGPTPNSVRHSTFLTHFGQFIDHDVISTPSMEENGKDIKDCCSGQIKFSCFTIKVPPNDPHFQGRTCMNMVRHFGTPPLDCKNSVREQVNQRSSFIDGSAIYGSNSTQERNLRFNRGGRLLESKDGLPPPLLCSDNIRTKHYCFNAGDNRVNEIPGLSVLHITWLRRHNLIADALRYATGITDDETLFQEAKRIVVAELQHITYNEFLPAVLDKRYLTIFNLRSRRYGHDNIYNPSVDPRTFNSFGAAVFRMGHSLVRNVVGHDNGRGQVKTYPIRKHFDNPDLMFYTPCEPGDFPPCGTGRTPPHGFEYMARWMSRAPKSRSDSALVNGIRNHLFEGRGSDIKTETMSFDLGALNIQRGREHGLPPYNAFRAFCGRYPAYHFTAGVHGGLEDHTPQNAANLARVYRSPHDIDLYAGGISEKPVGKGILGPTFSCLLAYQFSLYKHGDRFWYENNNHENPLTAFTEDQLAQIKQITHAKVLCSVLKDDYGDTSYQPSLFERQHIRSNRRIPCRELLNGNPLGFDITPFAHQLHLLRGNRRGRSWNPFDRFTGGLSPLHGRSIPLGPRPRVQKAPVNVGFRVPLPRNVFDTTLRRRSNFDRRID